MIKEEDGDDLPDNTQNDMSFAALNDMRVNVDDIDTDSFGTVDG